MKIIMMLFFLIIISEDRWGLCRASEGKCEEKDIQCFFFYLIHLSNLIYYVPIKIAFFYCINKESIDKKI